MEWNDGGSRVRIPVHTCSRCESARLISGSRRKDEVVACLREYRPPCSQLEPPLCLVRVDSLRGTTSLEYLAQV